MRVGILGAGGIARSMATAVNGLMAQNEDVELYESPVSSNVRYSMATLEENKEVVLSLLKNEKTKFNNTLEKGLKEFNKIIERLEDNTLNKDLAFKLYDTYGFPLELTVELAEEKNIKVDEEGFKNKFKEHQDKSRTIDSNNLTPNFVTIRQKISSSS